MASRFREFRFGWQVVLASALGIGLGMSPLPFYTLGVFAEHIAAEFDWSTGQVMSGLRYFTISALVFAPLIGFLSDRFGVRRIVLLSIVGLSVGLMLFSFNTGDFTLYRVLWAVLAALGAGTLPITFTRAINNWFYECRGLALGMALVSTGLFGALAVNLTEWLISLYGWRNAYIGIGMLPLLISLPAAYFLFRDTDDPKVADKVRHLRQDQDEDVTTEPGGLTFLGTLKDWRFWLLAYSFLPLSLAIGGPIPNLKIMMVGKGFSAVEATTLLSLIGIAVIIGRLLGGYLLDKIWAPAVAAVILCLPIYFCIVMQQPAMSYWVAASAILILGIAAGVEYDLLAYLVSRYFGMRSYATVYGMLYAAFAAGAGFGPGYFADAYAATGDYNTILKAMLIIIPACAIPLLLLGRYREFAPGTYEPTPSRTLNDRQ